jgi:hypothetical protein
MAERVRVRELDDDEGNPPRTPVHRLAVVPIHRVKPQPDHLGVGSTS